MLLNTGIWNFQDRIFKTASRCYHRFRNKRIRNIKRLYIVVGYRNTNIFTNIVIILRTLYENFYIISVIEYAVFKIIKNKKNSKLGVKAKKQYAVGQLYWWDTPIQNNFAIDCSVLFGLVFRYMALSFPSSQAHQSFHNTNVGMATNQIKYQDNLNHKQTFTNFRKCSNFENMFSACWANWGINFKNSFEIHRIKWFWNFHTEYRESIVIVKKFSSLEGFQRSHHDLSAN